MTRRRAASACLASALLAWCGGGAGASGVSVSNFVRGRSYLLSGSDRFRVGGRPTANPVSYDAANPNEGPFKVVFDSGDGSGKVSFENRAQGKVENNTWKAGAGRRIDVAPDPLFVGVYLSFLDGLVPAAVAERYHADVAKVVIERRPATQVVDLKARVSKGGDVLFVTLDNVRRYRVSVTKTSDGVDRTRRVAVRLVERARFSGPLVQ